MPLGAVLLTDPRKENRRSRLRTSADSARDEFPAPRGGVSDGMTAVMASLAAHSTGSRAKRLQAAEGVADDDVHPAETGDGPVVAFGQRAAREVSGEQVLGPGGESQQWLVDMA